MRLLLDTHAFLWWVLDDPQLVQTARTAISDPNNQLFFSAVSSWEISIKASLGKLKLPRQPQQFFQQQLTDNRFELLPITVEHTVAIYHLPHHHRDPFDRLLIAQCHVENLSLITNDSLIQQYAVRIVW